MLLHKIDLLVFNLYILESFLIALIRYVLLYFIIMVGSLSTKWQFHVGSNKFNKKMKALFVFLFINVQPFTQYTKH